MHAVDSPPADLGLLFHRLNNQLGIILANAELLETKAAKLGTAVLKGDEAVAGKMVPALFFGDAKMNNSFTLVDEVQVEKGGTATIFVKVVMSSFAWQRT